MRILVTGAAGFIGSALCKKLQPSGHDITAIDNFSDYYDVTLKQLRVKELLTPLDIEVLNLDICDRIAIEKLINSIKPDLVIHLAAQAGVRLKVNESHKYVESNLGGFSNVLVSTVENKVPYFLYASSSSVYGDQASIPYGESEGNLHPNSFYGGTKLANEILTSTLVSNSKTVARGLRFFTVYGPWGRPDMAYFRMLANTLVNSKLKIYGDGSIERDFTFIDDATNAIELLIDELIIHPQGHSDIVNVGGGNPVSINKLIEVVERISNNKLVFEKYERNLTDVSKTMADASKLLRLTGYRPKTEIDAGMLETFIWASKEDISVSLQKWIESC
jgi:UDP-glucuronate 4-epimerase